MEYVLSQKFSALYLYLVYVKDVSLILSSQCPDFSTFLLFPELTIGSRDMNEHGLNRVSKNHKNISTVCETLWPLPTLAQMTLFTNTVNRKVTKNAFDSCVLMPICINNLCVTSSFLIFMYILLYLQRSFVGGKKKLPDIFSMRPKGRLAKNTATGCLISSSWEPIKGRSIG